MSVQQMLAAFWPRQSFKNCSIVCSMTLALDVYRLQGSYWYHNQAMQKCFALLLQGYRGRTRLKKTTLKYLLPSAILSGCNLVRKKEKAVIKPSCRTRRMLLAEASIWACIIAGESPAGMLAQPLLTGKIAAKFANLYITGAPKLFISRQGRYHHCLS